MKTPFAIVTLGLSLFLGACPAPPATIPNVNGVYSGYIQGSNGTRLTSALALGNDGQVNLTAGFVTSTASGVVAFPMTGSMNGNRFIVSYRDSSGSMTMNGSVDSGSITGSFDLNTTSGNVSGSIFFTYSRPLSGQRLQAVSGSFETLFDWIAP
jgi:hypothetical protein